MGIFEIIKLLYLGAFGMFFYWASEKKFIPISSFKFGALMLSLIASLNLCLIGFFLCKLFGWIPMWELLVVLLILVSGAHLFYFSQTKNKILPSLAYMSLSEEHKKGVKNIVELVVGFDIIALLYLWGY